MKALCFGFAFTLFASTAQADMLSRWETSEEAIREQVLVLHGSGARYRDWTAADRNGKACLLSAMVQEFGRPAVESFIQELESTAARRMSYSDPFALSVDWARAAPLNRIQYDDVAPLAQACNSTF
ncbi:hypothetical protein L0666_16205 [Octadecabacter sp. CECT 8868]|uniref:hypothetical protein n=1 Tax=Octadecabacter algicola TaxID=2909342 RepID=UPI001F2088C3|nr:hypothetical protein [Octadecabacter algicola]MCF2906537.1 hypothetical protein [Octadecabacter algicola]